jgi:solute carrier family 25 phosphate transporter 23/24/25/41
MYSREGFYGFFKGNGINCAVQAPFTALEFYFYEVFKNTLYPQYSREELSFPQKLISGSLAGVSA